MHRGGIRAPIRVIAAWRDHRQVRWHKGCHVKWVFYVINRGWVKPEGGRVVVARAKASEDGMRKAVGSCSVSA